MGKYEVNDENDIHNIEYEKLVYYNVIANELAEANRLKRLELEQNWGKNELEDQA